MDIGQYVQVFLTFFFYLSIYKYAPKCSNNISKTIKCNSVLIEPLLITQLIKLQFSGLSRAQKFGNSFLWIQHVQIRLEHISKHLYQKNAITSYFWCIINYSIN